MNKNKFIENMKSKQWVRLLERPINLFVVSLFFEGTKSEYYNKALRTEIPPVGHAFYDDGVYFSKDTLVNTSKALEDIFKKNGIGEIKKIAESCYETAHKLHNFLEKSNDETKDRYSKFFKLYFDFVPHVPITNMSEKYLEKKLKELIKNKIESKNKIDYYFENLSYVERETEGTKELKGILDIATKIKAEGIGLDGDRAKNLINKHLEKYSYMKTWWNFEGMYTEEEIKERIKGHLKGDPEKELEKMKNFYKKGKDINSEFIKRYNLSSDEQELIGVVKEFVFMRTFRTESVFKANYLVKPLLEEIAEKLNISFDDLIYLQFDEIMDILKGKKIEYEELIKDRKKGWSLVLFEDERKVFTGEDLNIIRKEEVFPLPDTTKKELSGQKAWPGKIKGVVKIVKSVADCKKVEKGDILVAVMTFPQYIMAMEKAAAFVTDEGGILSHASIIAREMQKPCVIGTKSATKVLKDGDLVEVDADNGTVKILEKEK